MTPTTNAPQGTIRVQNTVFDLAKFDDLKLIKDVAKPAKPATLKEALEAAGNDESTLLDLIYEGLVEQVREKSKSDPSGWMDETEDGELVPYTGSFADESKGKLINAGILALAKMNGFTKGLDPKKKAELKDNAKAFLRANPAMLGGLVPAAPEVQS